MARINLEEIIIFVIILEIASIGVFSTDVFNAYYPNQKWNSTSNSLEYYVPDATPSIFANSQEYNNTVLQYSNVSNSSVTDPANLINPLGIVAMLGFYFNLIINVLSGGFLGMIMQYFIGGMWAGYIVVIMRILMVIWVIHVISGRIRWT